MEIAPINLDDDAIQWYKFKSSHGMPIYMNLLRSDCKNILVEQVMRMSTRACKRSNSLPLFWSIKVILNAFQTETGDC